MVEARHLDNIEGSFAIFDGRVCLVVGLIENAQLVSRLVYCNVNAMVQQQQFAFDTSGSKAITAEQKIKEIQEGSLIVSTIQTMMNTTESDIIE